MYVLRGFLYYVSLYCFFFIKQKTAYEMRISDWSSDVCSSDLRITLGVYEMGSTMKTLNTAMALDYGVAKMSSSYDARFPIHIGRFTIHDDHPKARWLSVPEIYMYSSNIGSAKMAVDEIGRAHV